MLHEARPKATIMLIGSQARGESSKRSDMDFLVVLPSVKFRRREMVLLSDLLRPLRLPVDVIVTGKKTFQEWSKIPGTLYHAAAKEGKVIFQAA